MQYLDDFNRLLLHALGPRKFGSLLWFPRAKQDLETLLDVIHQVFGGIGIVEKILANDELDRLLLRNQGERFGMMTGIDRRSGGWAVVWSGGTRRSGGGGLDLIQ